MLIKVKTGDYEVYDSGVFHVLESQRTVITVQDLTLQLVFASQRNGKPAVSVTPLDARSAEIRFTNFDGPHGVGNTDPMKVGSMNGRDLYLAYRIRSLNNKGLRSFEYTFYLN